MMSMIERLRLSRENEEAEARNNGCAQGAKWAEEQADFSQLRALEPLEDGQFGVEPIKDWPNWTAAEWVALTANSIPDDREVQYEALRSSQGVSIADEFWESCLGDEAARLTKSPDFVVGFVEGALQAWAEVKNEV